MWVTAVGDIFHPDDAPDAEPITITAEHLTQIVSNAAIDRERHGTRAIPIDLGHGTIEEPHDPEKSAAHGWAGGFEADDDGQLWAIDIEWTEDGAELAEKKGGKAPKFKFTSPVIFFAWRDQVNGDDVGARIHSVAITNSPAQGNGLPMVASHGGKYVLGASLGAALQAALDVKLEEKTEGTTDIDPWTRDSIIRQMGEQSGLDDLTVERVLRGDLERPSMDEVLSGFARVLPVSVDELRSAAEQDAGPAPEPTEPTEPPEPVATSQGAPTMSTKKITLTTIDEKGEPVTHEVEVETSVAEAIEAAQLSAAERTTALETQVTELTARLPKADEVKLSTKDFKALTASAELSKENAEKLATMEAEKRRTLAVSEGRFTPEEVKAEPFFGASKDAGKWALLLAARLPKHAWNPDPPKGGPGGDPPEAVDAKEKADAVVAAIATRKDELVAGGMKALDAFTKARGEVLGQDDNMAAVTSHRKALANGRR